MDIPSHVLFRSNNNIQLDIPAVSLCSSLVQCHSKIPQDTPCKLPALVDPGTFLLHIAVELKLLPDNGTKQGTMLSDRKFLHHNSIPQSNLLSVLSIPLHCNIDPQDMPHNRSHFDFHSGW